MPIYDLTKAAWAERRRRVVTPKRFMTRLERGAIDAQTMDKLIGRLEAKDLIAAATARGILR